MQKPSSPWLVLAITTWVQSLASLAVLTVPAMAPEVARAMGISPAYIGLYIAVVYVAGAIGSLAGGAAVGRYGSIRVGQAGNVLSALGLALCAVPSLFTIALGAFLIGLGYGPITPASSHLLARTTPAARMSLVFSIKQTGVPLGGMLAGFIVPPLVLVIGWQGALLCMALASLFSAFLAQPLRAELDADRDPARPLVAGHFLRPVHMVLSHPALRLLAVCAFFFSMAQVSLSAYVVTFVHEALAFDMVTAGLALAATQLGGVCGRIAWGWLADAWLGARRTLAVLGAIMSLCALATAFFPPGLPVALVLGVMVVFGASAIGWNGIYLGEVARLAPAGQASLATAGTLSLTFIGVMVGSPSFGAVASLFGTYAAGFLLMALITGACAIAVARSLRRPA